MKPRTLRLLSMLETYSSEDLQRLFASRMRHGESFRFICDSLLIPYNKTAEIVGWDRKSKTFSEPYRPQAASVPKCVELQHSQPPLDGHGSDDEI